LYARLPLPPAKRGFQFVQRLHPALLREEGSSLFGRAGVAGNTSRVARRLRFAVHRSPASGIYRIANTDAWYKIRAGNTGARGPGRKRVNMFEQTFKNIDDILHKDGGCTIEPD